MIEQWAKWQPIKGLEGKYYIDYFTNGTHGFEVILSKAGDRGYGIKLIFDKWIDGCNYADETHRTKLFCDLSEKYKNLDYGQWTFFKITNSAYLKWLSEESSGISDFYDLQHISLLAGDSVLDIACSYDPKIEIIIKK